MPWQSGTRRFVATSPTTRNTQRAQHIPFLYVKRAEQAGKMKSWHSPFQRETRGLPALRTRCDNPIWQDAHMSKQITESRGTRRRRRWRRRCTTFCTNTRSLCSHFRRNAGSIQFPNDFRHAPKRWSSGTRVCRHNVPFLPITFILVCVAKVAIAIARGADRGSSTLDRDVYARKVRE